MCRIEEMGFSELPQAVPEAVSSASDSADSRPARRALDKKRPHVWTGKWRQDICPFSHGLEVRRGLNKRLAPDYKYQRIY